jgi:hypothetical protein
MISGIASKGIDVAQNMATQRVIGYSRTVTRTKGKKNPKVIQENLNIGIQAWELGIIMVGLAAYEYVNGPGTASGNFANYLFTLPLNPSALNSATQNMGGFTSPNSPPIITLPGGGI